MTVSEALDAMRSDLPGCSLVAYADLSSLLVLSTSSVVKPMQEQLDALSQAAQIALDGTLADGAASVWDDEAAGEPAQTALLLTESEARVILRAGGTSAEALVCVCTPDSDLAAVIARGQAALDDILAAA